VLIPTDAVHRRTATRESLAFDGTAGLGRVIRRMVLTLQEEREQLTGAAFDVACDQLLDLVGLAAEGAVDSAPPAQRAEVEAQIRRYVRRHAADSGLTVAGVARALGWSTRYIQDVLQAAGTTSRDLIRTERLRAARTRLTSPDWRHRSITQIAYACGFTSHSSFATAYRREFGLTPRETRQASAPPSTRSVLPVM